MSQLHSIEGKKFGKWEVLSRDTIKPTNTRGNARWVCRCDCGTESVLDSKHLRKTRWLVAKGEGSGGCAKCGIRTRDGKSNDVSGELFGTWLVLKRKGTYGEERNKKSLWECECVHCGYICELVRGIITGNKLDGRGSSQCPQCTDKRRDDSKAALVGTQHGPFLIASVADDKAICICMRCYRESTHRCSYLMYKSSYTTREGCSKCTQRRKPRKDLKASYMATVRKNAGKRGIAVTVTDEYALSLFDGKCAISSVEIYFTHYDMSVVPSIRIPGNASLDRRDSSLPYQDGNIQWVHSAINIAKHCSTQEDFIHMCKLVAQVPGTVPEIQRPWQSQR